MSREPAYRPGDRVTFIGHEAGDPYILDFQFHVHVAEVVKTPSGEHEYMVELECTSPVQHHGPFRADRLERGWARNERG